MVYKTLYLYHYHHNNIEMSKEVLEISVMVDEQFDVNFNWLEGIFGIILKVFGK